MAVKGHGGGEDEEGEEVDLYVLRLVGRVNVTSQWSIVLIATY